MHSEVKVVKMLVQHNIPLSLSDELTPLFYDIFSDSEIAKKLSSRRTKTACIINGAIAPTYLHSLVEAMKNGPFAIAIDESNDNGIEKMKPLTVRIIDSESGTVHTQVLDMCLSSVSTAEGIFSKMNEVLIKYEVPWSNFVGISIDNTSVNQGCKNSIKTRGTNPSIM